VIGSYHDFVGTPENLSGILDQACAGVSDMAKIATTVNSWSDNRRLLEAMSSPRNKPVIVAGMGDMGQITRILGPSRGTFLTYVSPGTGIAAATGQLTIREILDVYRIQRAKASSHLIGVVGMPLGHSLSPLIHNRAFAALDLDFVYLKLPTTDVKDFFDNAEAIGIEGFSVTIPHKTAVTKFLEGQTPEALEAGAVNTVYKRNGKWWGDNTDVHGVRAALASAGFDPSDKTVVILGKGGGSKAAQVAVKGAKSITVLPRAEVGEAGSYRCDLLINATPVGMHPQVDTAPFNGEIHANVVFDMVYNPPITRLLRSAADQGKTIVQGTTMFLAQAARQFEIWTGMKAPAEIYTEKSL
jgi:3-dehydroquinate dehydratase / shikimate dehydrogenase